MAKWLDELFSLNKEAEQTNSVIEFDKKVKNSAWISGAMGIDEVSMAKEADDKMEAEIAIKAEAKECDECTGSGLEGFEGTTCPKCKGTGKQASKKTAAYEAFQTDEQVIDQDYLRDVKILSDYQLSEWLAEARAKNKNLPYPEMASELKEEAKKSVKSDRSGCEKELLRLHGENTLLDWKKKFYEIF